MGLLLTQTVLPAAENGVRVGIYRPVPKDEPVGIYLALRSSAEVSETRYVADISPAALEGLDALIVPQVRTPGKLVEARSVLRKWVSQGHGVMTVHDAVGYRKHPVLFPEFAKGVSNPFNRETGHGKFCVVTATHPATEGFQPPSAVEHGYYDQVLLESGKHGVVLVREGVVLDEQWLATGEPVVVTGVLGKGRYVANGLAIGLDENGKQSVPKDDEQKLFIGLVGWLAGQGENPRVTDAGPGVKVARGLVPEEDTGPKKDVWEKTAELRAQAVESWEGEWRPSGKPAVPAVEESDFKTPVDFPASAVKPSGYTPVAEGWSRTVLRDEWRIQQVAGTETNSADDEGMRLGYFKPDCDDSEWETQPVPKICRRFCGNFTGVTWYRRRVSLPDIAKKERVVLTFTRCGLETKVWMNGRYIGEHLGGTTAFEFDVTDAVKGGQENLLAVRVFDIQNVPGKFVTPDGRVFTRRPYYHNLGHLWGEVYVTVKPELYSVRTLITPHLESSEIEVDSWVLNAGRKRDVDLRAEVRPAPPPLAKGKGASSSVKLKSLRLARGVTRHAFRVPMKGPVLWTPENPFLYTIELKNGRDVLARERFGFREFKTEGPYFVLNGKRINLVAHGIKAGTFSMSRRIEIDNEGLFLTRYLLAAKSWNANTIYTMGTPHPPQFYERCDELGFMVYADWIAAHWRFVNPPMTSGWNKGEREIEVWMADLYNHASMVLVSLGAELFERYAPKPYTHYNELLNPAYDALKAMDKQGRPICASSGRGTYRDSDAKTDVHDYHFYPSTIAGSWTDEEGRILRIWHYALAHSPVKPVIQYEMDGHRPWNEDLKSIRAVLQDEQDTGRIDRGRVIELFQQKAYRMGLGWASSLYGFRRYVADLERHDDWRQGAGWQIYTRKNVGQASRILGPMLAGYCPTAETFNVVDVTEDGTVPDAVRGWLHQRLGKGWDITDDLAKKRFVQAEGYLTWQRINNPKLICLDRYDQNLFAGDVLTADVFAVNDIDALSAPWTARCVIRDAQGKVLDDRTADLGRVPGFKRRKAAYTYAIPGDLPTGFYRIDLYLVEGDTVVSDNYEEFFVLGKADLLEKVSPASGLRVALYDTRAQMYKTGKGTAAILDELQVPYVAVTNFDAIADYELLIVGADSVDKTVRQAAGALNMWMLQGGRLLQLEQSTGGSIPYWRKLKLLAGKPHVVAEIIEANHPVFKGLNFRHFERWSEMPGCSTPGQVYRLLLGPIDDSVLASAATGVPRNNAKNNQMVLTETHVGKGRLVMSQLQAVQRYGEDAAATRFLWNLLEYVVGEQLWPVVEEVEAEIAAGIRNAAKE